MTDSSASTDRVAPPAFVPPTFIEAFKVWLKIGLLSFGGPAGQIALMHRILVDEKKWLTEPQFLHALNFCMLLPGPEAQQLATYSGWLLHGIRGGLVAGLLFILPGIAVMLGLSYVYVSFAHIGFVAAIFFGIQCAVFAVVVEALLRISKRMLKSHVMYVISAAAFIALFLFDMPFPVVILSAGLVGLWLGRYAPHLLGASAASGEREATSTTKPSLMRACVTLVTGLAVWWVPVFALLLALGPDHVLVREALFFSKMAVVSFGGAYAVLAYVAQVAVTDFGWLVPHEMLAGLGLAETTPGPLILVLQFIGYVAAHRLPEPFDPVVAGVLGALVTIWVTFVPCFLWIFVAAPYVEAVRQVKVLNAALTAITAAIVGVILNLAVWFGLHVFFGNVAEVHVGPLRLWWPDAASLDLWALALAAAALIAMLRFHAGMMVTLGGCAALGLVIKLL